MTEDRTLVREGLLIEPMAMPVARLHVLPRGVAMLPSLGAAVDVIWPLQPNRWAKGQADVFWLGPESWAITGDLERLRPLVESRLAAETHLFVDVTAGQCGYRLLGPKAVDLLASGCSLDLRRKSFGERDCARTLVAQCPVLLWSPAPDAFHLLADVSLGAYLGAWLASAAEAFEPAVQS